jgi:hypothetical protein
MDRDEMSNLFRGPSIDASYLRTPSDGKSSHCLWQGELKNKFSEIRKQADQAEKTIIHHQNEIMAALKSIQGSTIFATATKFKKMMSDF